MAAAAAAGLAHVPPAQALWAHCARHPGLQGIPRRGPDGKLLGRSVVHAPSGHKAVPDGMTIDAGGCGRTTTHKVGCTPGRLPSLPCELCQCSWHTAVGRLAAQPCRWCASSFRADGNLWVAIGESGSVVCYSAATGARGCGAREQPGLLLLLSPPLLLLGMTSPENSRFTSRPEPCCARFRRRGAAAGGAAGEAPHRLHLWRGGAGAPLRDDAS